VQTFRQDSIVTIGSPESQRENLFGSFWMIAAMAAFALEDSFIKAASETLVVGQILTIFGIGGAFTFAMIACCFKTPLFTAAVVSRPMQIRVLFEIVGRLFYALAITLIPLSAATVILQATPLVVVTGAAGVLVILQPGTEGFSALSLLAVIGMIGFAGRDLASRAAPASLNAIALGFYGFLSIIVAGALVSTWQGTPLVWPQTEAIFALIGAILFGVGAYICLMNAMRTGDVSAVTPFRYTRLIFGGLLGITIFGEQLTTPMIIGSALIVLSGLFILARGKSRPTA